jgi:hypothetical protein
MTTMDGVGTWQLREWLSRDLNGSAVAANSPRAVVSISEAGQILASSKVAVRQPRRARADARIQSSPTRLNRGDAQGGRL